MKGYSNTVVSFKEKGYNMIYIFRKEMRKWHSVLWVVFIAMAVSGVSFMFFGGKGRGDVKIAWVNGEPIHFDQYRMAVQEFQMRVESVKNLARMYGISEDVYLKLLGMDNPDEIALDTCIREKLVDQIQKSFNIYFGAKYFKDEIIKAMPAGITDEAGRINMEAYQYYLNKLSVTPADFEGKKKDDLKRNLIIQFMAESGYIPSFELKEIYKRQNAKKSFDVMVLPLEHFLSEAKKTPLSEKELQSFYQENKENYRVPEMCNVRYWMVSVDDYAKHLDIDEQTAKAFYEKNKSSTYRIPPKIKVRHILIKNGKDAEKTAQALMKEAKANPAGFAELAKKHSHDSATAKNGGLLDYFGRKTHDQIFENAAFRLQKEGDISDVVKTPTGFEIIQLAGRISASEKPFDSVKEEIIKAIKSRKASSALKGDLEIMMHDARSNLSAIESFVKKNELESKEIGWLSEKDVEGKDIKSQIAQKLFGAKKGREFGYVAVDGSFAVYQVVGVEKSFIAKLQDVTGSVSNAIYEKKAKKILDTTSKSAKLSLIGKHELLSDVAGKLGLQVVTTEKIGVNDKFKGFDSVEGFAQAAFELDDAGQALLYEHEKGCYVVQLKQVEWPSEESFVAEKQKLSAAERSKNNGLNSRAFIASLQRNAKIEIDQKVVNMLKGNVRGI